MVGDSRPNIASSDTFVIPPNQDLRYSTYVYTWSANSAANITIKDVDTQSVLFEAPIKPQSANQWIALSGTFKTGGSPVTAQVVCTSVVSKITFVFVACLTMTATLKNTPHMLYLLTGMWGILI